ncbi:hypothetical protein BB560_002110 [Smittium megazygosporum]|uniref:Acyl-CoA thioesterase 2 C-terminal domain-containing protein n=1 Tax=Smittium megazygosporum TaxID=133381 RepID=A0A2T9ZFP4_9FUNG|nr:hypothetical protein BB560_002109 [Smittium megazygosporum]PVV03406.1 hypothetical protein BB560_002110 [Smittium megazygosporum]
MPDVYSPEHLTYPVYKHVDGNLPDIRNIGQNMDVRLFDIYPLKSRTATLKDPILQDQIDASIIFGRSQSYIEQHKAKKPPPYSLRWFNIDFSPENQFQNNSFALMDSSFLHKKSSTLHPLYLALLSDFWGPSLVSHPYFKGHNMFKYKNGMIVTIDHSVWFHSLDFDLSDWVLFDTLSPILKNDRLLIQGRIFSLSGVHLATISQENIFRIEHSSDAITNFVFSGGFVSNNRISNSSEAVEFINQKGEQSYESQPDHSESNVSVTPQDFSESHTPTVYEPVKSKI